MIPIMPGKNTRGGKKHKRGKNQSTTRIRNLDDIAKRQDHGGTVVYGRITKATGNRRFEVLCQKDDEQSATGNGDEELQTLVCSLKGSFRKRVSKDMYVLVQLHDYNVSQGVIIEAYTEDEVEALRTADLWDYPEGDVDVRIENKATDAMGIPMDLMGSDTDTDSEDEDDHVEHRVISASASGSGSGSASAMSSVKVMDNDSDIDIDAI